MDQQQPRVVRARVQARPAGASPAEPMRAAAMPQASAPGPFAPNLMGATPTAPMGQAPFRIPDGRSMGGGSIMRQRSVFDETVRGNGAQVKQVRLMGGAAPILQDAPVPTVSMGRVLPGAQAFAPRPADSGPNLWLGQDDAPPVEPSAIERVVQREMPSAGFSPQEAGALADALTGALAAAAAAIAEDVSCGNVDSFIVEEVRVIQGMLRRFAAEGAPGDRLEELGPEDLVKVDAVLACQSTYQEVSGARAAKTAAIVVGGIVVGGIILSIVA